MAKKQKEIFQKDYVADQTITAGRKQKGGLAKATNAPDKKDK